MVSSRLMNSDKSKKSAAAPKKSAPQSKKSAAKPKATIKKNVVAKAAPVKRAKKTKIPKDPNKPKRARSAYLFFCQEERKKIVKSRPDISAPDVLRACGAAWKELTEAQKQPWQKMQQDDKVRATSEMKKYAGAAKEMPGDASDADESKD